MGTCSQPLVHLWLRVILLLLRPQRERQRPSENSRVGQPQGLQGVEVLEKGETLVVVEQLDDQDARPLPRKKPGALPPSAPLVDLAQVRERKHCDSAILARFQDAATASGPLENRPAPAQRQTPSQPRREQSFVQGRKWFELLPRAKL